MKTKIALALATGTLLAATVLPAAAFASTTNHNPPKPPVNKNTVKLTQVNKSLVLTGVFSVAGSGGNTITGSTDADGKDPSITTGKATSDVKITVGGSSNSATVDPCGCTGTITPTVADDPGSHSITAVTDNSVDVKQINKSAILTVVVSAAGSGGNTISGNTGEETSITTGNAKSNVDISVTGSTNSLNSTPTP